jgi:hypothetical protein
VLALAGQASLSGGVAIDGGTEVDNSGSLVWTGGALALGAGDGSLASHAGTLVNAGGALFQIEGDGSVNGAGFSGSATIDNAGSLVKSGGQGSTTVYAAVSNTGTIEATSGTLAFQQAVGGAGAFVLDGDATLDFAAGVGAGSAMQFLYPGGTLEAQGVGSFAASVSGFGSLDVIDAAGMGFVTGTTTVGFSCGPLTVADGAARASFMLVGSYAAGGFAIGSDGHAGTQGTYA